MQGRFRLHKEALLFLLMAVGAGSLMAFFFIDKPLWNPQLLAVAEATEPEFSAVSQVQESQTDQRQNARNIALPSGFQPEWKTLRLDSRIPVQVLSKKFTLSQAEDHVGSEYYDYAAYLFEQMAEKLPEQSLSLRLKDLSLEAQTLGASLRQAAAVRYDGPPREDMSHLQVRSSILFYLNDLNPRALVTARYNQHGRLLSQENPSSGNHPGEALAEFSRHVGEVLNDPAAAQYPETMKLVQSESRLLEQLANHLTLRWESSVYCKQSCDGNTLRIRVYVQQTLPEREIAARI